MSSKVHLPSLNGIRAIAVLMVLLSHTDQFSSLLGIRSLNVGGLGLGWKGVVLFFTLSGFLITYLLELEKKEFKKIHFIKFYYRRVLRIWPIYYLIIFLTVLIGLILPDLFIAEKSSLKSLFNFLFFLGNYEYVFGLGILSLTPLWSVAVEEQFYIFWPWVIAKTKNSVFNVFVFLALYLMVKFAIQQSNVYWYKFIYISSFSCMAIGAIGALLYINKSKIVLYLFKPIVQIVIILIFLCLHFLSVFHFFTLIEREIFSIIDMLLIINLAFNRKTIFTLEYSFFNRVGIVSYGMYIYHMLIIFLLTKFFTFWEIKFSKDNILISILLFIIISFFSFLVAQISYQTIEKKFLSYKGKFALIKSST